jgi:hypothetical protein
MEIRSNLRDTYVPLRTLEHGLLITLLFGFTVLLWLRIVRDTIFIVAGVLPIVAAAVDGYLHLRSERPTLQLEPAWKPEPEPVYAGD